MPLLHGIVAANLLVVAGLLLSSPGLSLSGNSGPRIVFATLKKELGKCVENSSVEAEFRFKNGGDETLVVENIKTSCAQCSAVAVGRRRIEPGEWGVIQASVNTHKRSGGQSFSVNVRTNDPVTPNTTLELKFSLVAEFTLTPERIEFGRVEPEHGVLERTARIEAIGELPPRLRVKSYNQSLFRVEVTSATLATVEKPVAADAGASPADDSSEPDSSPLHHATLRVQIADSPPPGDFLENVLLETDYPNVPLLRIPVVGTVREPAELESSKVFMGIVRDGRPASKSVSLKTTESDFRIREVVTDVPGLSAEAAGAGNVFRIIMKLDPSKARSFVEGDVVVRTSSPYAPELRIHVTGMVKPK